MIGKQKSLEFANKRTVIFLCFLTCLALAACGEYDKVGVSVSGENSFNVICVDGVEYLQRDSRSKGYFSGHFKPDGSLYICDR